SIRFALLLLYNMNAKLLLICIVAAFIASEASAQYLYSGYPYAAAYGYPYSSYSWGYPGYGYYWGSNKGQGAGPAGPGNGPAPTGPSGLTGNQ
ncbi:hypothetical protein PENTCL1PPCAC_12264, partial [Pristionchus entomophagus]